MQSENTVKDYKLDLFGFLKTSFECIFLEYSLRVTFDKQTIVPPVMQRDALNNK